MKHKSKRKKNKVRNFANREEDYFGSSEEAFSEIVRIIKRFNSNRMKNFKPSSIYGMLIISSIFILLFSNTHFILLIFWFAFLVIAYFVAGNQEDNN